MKQELNLYEIIFMIERSRKH